MEPEVQKHKYLPVLVTVLVMLFVTAGAVAGVWYFMDKQAKEDKTAAEKTTQDLQKQINELSRTQVEANTADERSIEEAKIDCTGTYQSKIYGFSISCPTGWKVAESGSAGQPGGLSLYKDDDKRLILVVNDPGHDAGMASYTISYNMKVENKKTILTNRQESPKIDETIDADNPSFSLQAGMAEYGVNTYRSYMYCESKSDLVATEKTFKSLLESITFN